MIQTVSASRFIYDWNVFQYRLRHLTSLLTSNNCVLCRLTSDIEHSAMWDFPLLENLSGTCSTFGPSYWFSLTSQHHNHTIESLRTENRSLCDPNNNYSIKHYRDNTYFLTKAALSLSISFICPLTWSSQPTAHTIAECKNWCIVRIIIRGQGKRVSPI